jgi:4-amino-4-deoxy-L-arabinose transferase-like glycosyltransferase
VNHPDRAACSTGARLDAARPATNRAVALRILLGVALIYVALSRGMFLFGDDILMFQVTEAMVERRSVDVTSPTQSEVAAIAPDMTGGFNAAAIPGEDGRRYAKYGIGLSLVAIPLYAASDLLAPVIPVGGGHDPAGNDVMGPRVYGSTLTNAVIAAAVVALVFLMAVALGFAQATALILALVTAIATPIAHYSGTFLSEPLAALCLAATVYGILRASTTGDVAAPAAQRWLLISGFAAGLGLATRPAVAVALVAPALWVMWLAWRGSRMSIRDGSKVWVVWVTPLASWLAVVGLYNWSRFGSVTETGYGGEADAYTTPILTGLYGLLASPGRGLIWYAPPLLIAFAGAFWFRRRNPALTLVIAGMLVATLLLYGRYYAWHGGGVWGPRFLVPLIPVLILPAGEIVERVWETRRAAVPVVVAVLSGIFVSALVLLVPFDRHVAQYAASASAHDHSLWSLAGSPIVTHLRDVTRLDVTLDIAAVRYASPGLAVLALVFLLAGTALIIATSVRCLRHIPGRSPFQ